MENVLDVKEFIICAWLVLSVFSWLFYVGLRDLKTLKNLVQVS